ncbi:MAG: hypothetical protein ABH824_05900 [Nanoarchaeota archaeon]
MGLENFDGVLIIHGDYSPGTPGFDTAKYISELRDATQEMREVGKKVLFLPYNDNGRKIDLPQDLVASWTTIEPSARSPWYDGRQAELDAIVEEIGTNPEKTRLAVGGVHALGCVKSWLKYFCSQYKQPDSQEVKMGSDRMRNPINHGEIIPALTDLGIHYPQQ